MKTIPSKLRWLGTLTALAVMLGASASGFSWQCLDGTPCSMHHRLVMIGTAARTELSSPRQHCAHCPNASARTGHPAGRLIGAQRCVLADFAAQIATLAGTSAFHASATAVLSVQSSLAPPVIAGIVLAPFRPNTHAPPLLAVHFGRAPPMRA